MLKTGPRTFVAVGAAIIAIGLYGWLVGFFWLLATLLVICVPGILLIAWRTGGSSQKQHDASMDRLPGIDKAVKQWIARPTSK